MHRKCVTFILCLLVAASLLGCTSQAKPLNADGSEWAYNGESLQALLQEDFQASLNFSFQNDYAYYEQIKDNKRTGAHMVVLENFALVKNTEQATNTAIDQALVHAKAAAESALSEVTLDGKPLPVAVTVEEKQWFRWYETLALSHGSFFMERELDLNQFLKDNLKLNSEIVYNEQSHEITINLSVDVPFLIDMWKPAVQSSQEYFAVRMSYAYLLTLFGEDGQEKEYSEPADAAAYLNTIAQPVKTGGIRKGWYGPRDGGTRKHTGNDIVTNRGTPIYSVSDGVILYIGTNPMAGNFVVVLDDAGYEHHYYHMNVLTKDRQEGERVQAGDQIGVVGCTGNSAVDHLHLSIIHPNGQYIDPYPYMVLAREEKR